MTQDQIQMQQVLERQKADFLASGPVDAETRINRLDRLAARCGKISRNCWTHYPPISGTVASSTPG